MSMREAPPVSRSLHEARGMIHQRLLMICYVVAFASMLRHDRRRDIGRERIRCIAPRSARRCSRCRSPVVFVVVTRPGARVAVCRWFRRLAILEVPLLLSASNINKNATMIATMNHVLLHHSVGFIPPASIAARCSREIEWEPTSESPTEY